MDLYEQAAAFPFAAGHGRRVLTRSDMRGVSMQAVSRRLRRGVAHRAARGAYVFGDHAPSLVERVDAALAVSAPGAVAGFHSAAALLGFGVARSSDIHLVVACGERFPQRRGIRVHQTMVPFESVEAFGLPCTPAARTAIDLARSLPRREALPVLDAAMYASACTRDDLLAAVAPMIGIAGVRQARELVLLADGRAQCRQESQLRLILHDGGLTGFVPQLLVTDGTARHYLDLGDPDLMVGAEYDGSSHVDKLRLRADRARHNFLEGLRWRMRYFTSHDLYHAPQAIPPTIRRAADL